VWWAERAYCAPWHQQLLDPVERQRCQQYRSASDRDRFTLGVALSRLVLGAHLNMAPTRVVINRSCVRCSNPHGRPRLAIICGLDFSISHANNLISVAITLSSGGHGSRSRLVGVDVEHVVKLREPSLPNAVLSAVERAAFDQLDATNKVAAFFRYWVRKEALLKATGDGLSVPLTQLTFSDPGQQAQLREWAGRPLLPNIVTMYDLHPPPGYPASLALVGRKAVVHEFDASEILCQA
jgi:4'-phosphopantetheinyl transferase